MEEPASFSQKAEKVAQLADVGSLVGDQSADYLKARAIQAQIARTQYRPSQAQAAAAMQKSRQLKNAANLLKIGSRATGVAALAPSIYEVATSDGTDTERYGNLASVGTNIAGMAAPVFGAGSAIGGAISYPIQRGLKKAFGNAYGEPKFTLNPFAELAEDIPARIEIALAPFEDEQNKLKAAVRNRRLKDGRLIGEQAAREVSANRDYVINPAREHQSAIDLGNASPRVQYSVRPIESGSTKIDPYKATRKLESRP